MYLQKCLLSLLFCAGCSAHGSGSQADSEAVAERIGDQLQAQCVTDAAPETRAGFPALLNCMGLLGDAVEVGVQAGVHASSFLESWQGKRLRLVDKWGPSEEGTSSSRALYVDIANVHGVDIGLQHRSHCEARLAKALRSGRAEILGLDSAVAAASIGDGELDFVYLDARHDFAGVVTDIQAWWPKVKVGGIFAGHDFVDGEFPEGDFFWISALGEVLPGLEGNVHVTSEKNLYPSFFVVKTPALADLMPLALASPEDVARRLYAERSRYFALWRGMAAGSGLAEFAPLCNEVCSKDCDGRIQEFTPTRSSGSTLRPFACSSGAAGTSQAPVGPALEAPSEPDVCATEMLVDVKAYHDVCLERCNVTCKQRSDLFSQFGAALLSV